MFGLSFKKLPSRQFLENSCRFLEAELDNARKQHQVIAGLYDRQQGRLLWAQDRVRALEMENNNLKDKLVIKQSAANGVDNLAAKLDEIKWALVESLNSISLDLRS